MYELLERHLEGHKLCGFILSCHLWQMINILVDVHLPSLALDNIRIEKVQFPPQDNLT